MTKKAGLKVRLTTDILQAIRPRSAELGDGPLAAMTFSCRRWNDASYLIRLCFGAIDPLIEGAIEAYMNYVQRERGRRLRGPTWLGLTIVANRQSADDAIYDDRAKAEFERYIVGWFSTCPEQNTSDIEAGIRSQIESDWQTGSFATRFEHPEAICRRAVIAREVFGWRFPSNAELERRLAKDCHEPARESLAAFIDWWEKEGRVTREGNRD
ncbi:MAG: hypothetical protein GC155_17940 [Alphaproteobacteria bacterium]|nr:hypothetical protein [Alphaproteobacteria bacterium]